MSGAETKVLAVARLPMAVDAFTKQCRQLGKAHAGKQVLIRQQGEIMVFYVPGGHDATACDCHYCIESVRRQVLALNGEVPLPSRGMVICPLCGCKRCPHASHHEHACTRSNEPGQHGSVYGDYVVPEADAEEEEVGA